MKNLYSLNHTCTRGIVIIHNLVDEIASELLGRYFCELDKKTGKLKL